MKAVIMLSAEDRKNIQKLFNKIKEEKERVDKLSEEAEARGDKVAVEKFNIWTVAYEYKVSAIYDTLKALGIDVFSWDNEDGNVIERQD